MKSERSEFAANHALARAVSVAPTSWLHPAPKRAKINKPAKVVNVLRNIFKFTKV